MKRAFRGRSHRAAVRSTRPRWVAVLEATREGRAFVARDGERIFIEREDLGRALPGDRVEVELESGGRGRARARVRKVLERHERALPGVVYRYHGALAFRPYRADTSDHFALEDPAGLTPGDQVAVLRLPPLRRGEPGRVRVVERLGRADEARWDSQLVALELGLPVEFPDEALEEAAEAAVPPRGVPRGRLDLRALLTVTIDPPDAKDHDDALSLTPAPGGYELGIHIADVSHYVRPGSALDEEALRRGNSVYLPDTVLPMLPPELSGDVCSLKPDVDRFALSVLVRTDAHGRRLGHRIAATVVRSSHRLSYEEAEQMLKGETPAPPALRALLRDLWKVTAGARALWSWTCPRRGSPWVPRASPWT